MYDYRAPGGKYDYRAPRKKKDTTTEPLKKSKNKELLPENTTTELLEARGWSAVSIRALEGKDVYLGFMLDIVLCTGNATQVTHDMSLGTASAVVKTLMSPFLNNNNHRETNSLEVQSSKATAGTRCRGVCPCTYLYFPGGNFQLETDDLWPEFQDIRNISRSS